MLVLATITRWEVLAIAIGFSLVFAGNILTGRIRVSGLLSGDRSNGESYFSWGRVQLLAVSLYIAGQCLFHVYLTPSRFPEVSMATVAIFGASATLYTCEKAWVMRLDRPGN